MTINKIKHFFPPCACVVKHTVLNFQKQRNYSDTVLYLLDIVRWFTCCRKTIIREVEYQHYS